MRARSVLAVAAVIALVAAPAANAKARPKPKPKPKIYCNLLQDKPNDGTSDINPLVTSPALDIRSGDVATGPKTMVAVLRLASTDYSLATDHWGQTLGYAWTFGVSSNVGQKFTFGAILHAYSGSMTSSVAIDNVGVTVKSFKVDKNANTFTWVIDRSVDKTLTRKSTVFKEFRGTSKALDATADAAPDTPTPLTVIYPDKALSCVHAD
jgi:hypothetical protein